MIVYGASLSPFVRKVIVLLEEKGVSYELKAVGLGSRSPDFLAASPFAKMPALRDGDFLVSDSSVICAYLDRKHPERPLIPQADLAVYARVLWFEEMADAILSPAGAPVFFNRVVAPRFLGQSGDEAAAELAATKTLPPVLAYLERVLEGGTACLVGDEFTLADIAVAAQCVNLRYAGVAPDRATTPRLAAFLDRVWARPSFQAALALDAKLLPPI